MQVTVNPAGQVEHQVAQGEVVQGAATTAVTVAAEAVVGKAVTGVMVLAVMADPRSGLSSFQTSPPLVPETSMPGVGAALVVRVREILVRQAPITTAFASQTLQQVHPAPATETKMYPRA